MKKVILSDKEFNALPEAPQPKQVKVPPKVVLSDEEMAAPSPEVSVDPSALQEIQGGMEIVAKPFKWAATQLERPSAALKTGISNLANKQPPMEAFKASVRSAMNPEMAPTSSETLQDVGVPKNIAENPVVSTIADLTVFDPLVLAAGTAKLTSKLGELSKLSRTAAERNYGKIQELAGHSKAGIDLVEKNKDALKVALSESDITSNLRRPNELKKILTGKSLGLSDVSVDDIDLPLGVDAGDFIYGGKIGKEAKVVDDLVEKASGKLKARGIPIWHGELADIVYPSRIRLTDIPGTGVGEDEFFKIKKIADRYVGNLFSTKDLSLSDLQDFKKRLGERLSSKDFSRLAEADPALAMEKEILSEMYLRTKGIIINLSDKVGLGADIDAANKKMQAYYTLNNVLTKPASIQVQAMSKGFPSGDVFSAAGKIGVGAAVGEGALGGGLGIPRGTGMATGAAIGASRSGPEFRNIKNYMGYVMPQNVGSKALGAEMSLRASESNPQVSFTPPQQKMYDLTKAKSLITSQLPPYTEFVLANKELFLQKVEMQLGTMEAQEMRHYLEHTPNTNKIKPMIAKFAYANPGFFAMDDYNRFDGIIQNDVDIAKAMSDIKRSKVGSIERMRLIEKLKDRKEGVTWPK